MDPYKNLLYHNPDIAQISTTDVPNDVKCTLCNTTVSKKWRRGRNNGLLLCNFCGIFEGALGEEVVPSVEPPVDLEKLKDKEGGSLKGVDDEERLIEGEGMEATGVSLGSGGGDNERMNDVVASETPMEERENAENSIEKPVEDHDLNITRDTIEMEDHHMNIQQPAATNVESQEPEPSTTTQPPAVPFNETIFENDTSGDEDWHSCMSSSTLLSNHSNDAMDESRPFHPSMFVPAASRTVQEYDNIEAQETLVETTIKKRLEESRMSDDDLLSEETISFLNELIERAKTKEAAGGQGKDLAFWEKFEKVARECLKLNEIARNHVGICEVARHHFG
ncbi:hypothetical protein HDU76_009065 [Blyttiomyces sp. JEL0837]|nr:hypothetical protein HDU76_009065 [Blyttiomyces sp. JEL0837]